MIRLFKKIFKRESQLNYIIAEYEPINTNSQYKKVDITDRNLDKQVNIDKEKINKILESF
jgi:hypothetical protein